jgi:hypothetical protein
MESKPSPKYSLEEKAELVKKVCDLYESQNATIESCCKSVGVSYRAFRLWTVEHADFAELYKKARNNQDNIFWEDIIRPKSKKSLLRLIEGEEYTETKEEDGLTPMGPVSKTTITKKVVLPNPTAVIFAMKGEYKDRFTDRQEITGKDGKELPAAIITVRMPSEPPKEESK